MAANSSDILNVSMAAPLLAYSLYERCNHLTDFEGLILGTYNLHKRSAVSDMAAQSEFNQHELVIKKLPITGVRFSFYDYAYSLDAKKLSTILAKNSVATNNGRRENLQILGWFTFSRIYSAEFLHVYTEISRRLKEYTGYGEHGPVSFTPSFTWGGPLFLCTYERPKSTDSLKLDIGECKYQMYCLNAVDNGRPSGADVSPSGGSTCLKPIKFTILNVGDTSHAEYSSIDNLNSSGAGIVNDPEAVNFLSNQIQESVRKLAENSLTSLNQVVCKIGSMGKCSSENSGATGCNNKIQFSPSVTSWEMVENDPEEREDIFLRGQKREKADQSSSSGGNSDEMEGVLNASQIPPASRRVGAGMSHTTKRSRGAVDSLPPTAPLNNTKPLGKGRGRKAD